MSSYPTSGVLPPSYPPTGGGLPPYENIRDILIDIDVEMGVIEFEPNFFYDQKKVDRLLYLSQLANYWQDVYLVLYGERL